MKILRDIVFKAPPEEKWILTRRGLCASQKETDRWHTFTYGEVQEWVQRLAAWFREEHQIQAQQVVGLLSENRIETVLSILAAHACGAIAYPLYPSYSAKQVSYAIDAFKIRLLLISNRDQAKKVTVPIANALFESEEFHTVLTTHKKLAHEDFVPLDEMSAGFIIATSGTTGEAKGALLSHYGPCRAGERIIEFGCRTKWERLLSLLPFSHVAGLQDLCSTAIAQGTLWMIETKEELLQAFRETRPTHMVCVPNLFEKVRKTVESKVRQSSFLKRLLFRLALKLGHRNYTGKISLPEKCLLPLANALVFKKIKAFFGGHIEAFGTGAAPLSVECYDFYWSVGLPLGDGYGLTEASGIVTGNLFLGSEAGTVGRPAHDTSVRIAEDGEVLIKTKTLTLGYVNAPFELTTDGYYRTGDLGAFTDTGYLKLIGRKKELIVLNTGENIAPSKVEEAIKRSPFIEEAIAIGEGRKFLSIAIIPADNISEKDIPNEIEKYSDALATFERPKKYFIIPEIPADVLTPTMKVKRPIFHEYFKDQIDALY